MENVYKMLQNEIEEARANLKQKEDNFNNALPQFFDIANTELTIAINHLNVCLMKAKLIAPECKVNINKDLTCLQKFGYWLKGLVSEV